MPGFWWRQAGIVALLALGFAMLWLSADLTVALAVLTALLFFFLLYHLRHVASLRAWLAEPKLDEVPQGSPGPWEEIFSRLYHMGRVQSRSQLHLSRVVERFQSAARAIPDGIVLLDESNQIEWCNPSAERQFGIDNERDRGQFITYLLRATQFSQYMQDQNYGEPLILRANPNSLVLSIQLIPFGDRQKLLISRDITQMDRVETVRRDFVANVSHELRTPLTVLTGFLETFAGTGELTPEEIGRYHELMREQGQRMQRLVEDLLTLSRLESTQTGEEAPVDVPGLLRQLYNEAQTLSVGRHQLELSLEATAGLLGNVDELRSAFTNLISNAVRYTPPAGKIVLRWQLAETGAIFSVEDSGEGIEPQHIPRLTERFYRVDRSRSRETGGTGLGLSIVKHVLNRHKAQLEIRSTPGKGSVFSAIFPLSKVL